MLNESYLDLGEYARYFEFEICIYQIEVLHK